MTVRCLEAPFMHIYTWGDVKEFLKFTVTFIRWNNGHSIEELELWPAEVKASRMTHGECEKGEERLTGSQGGWAGDR